MIQEDFYLVDYLDYRKIVEKKLLLPYYLLLLTRLRIKTNMKSKSQNNDSKLCEEQLVENFFTSIRERQQIEEEYYNKGNPLLLLEIQKAKERIRKARRLIRISTREIKP